MLPANLAVAEAAAARAVSDISPLPPVGEVVKCNSIRRVRGKLKADFTITPHPDLLPQGGMDSGKES